jgi:hypothetical protein
MLLKFSPKVEHLKCVVLTPKEGLTLERTMVHLLPGTNEVTDDEFKAMRGNIVSELESGEIVILAQKVGDGRGKPGGRKAKNLVDMPVNIAVKYVSECNNPETLEKWYKEVTKEEVRLAITKRMKALEVEEPTEEIPEAPNAAPMSLDEFDEDDENEFDEESDDEDSDSSDDNEDDSEEELEKDVSELTVKELKAKCEELGIDTKGMKKEDLIAALENNSEKE